jgi:hypothetical protein
LFDAVLQTMIDSNFEMFKRINDNEAFGQLVRQRIFDKFTETYGQNGIYIVQS